MPEGWYENPDRLQQRDLDACWAQKNGVDHYGHNNNIDGSQMLSMFLDLVITDDYIRADSTYPGECLENLLSLGGF